MMTTEKIKIAELVSELLSEYLKNQHSEDLSRTQVTLLNKLSFTTAIILPAELQIELSKRLQNKADAKTPFEIIRMTRELVRGESCQLDDITVWKIVI